MSPRAARSRSPEPRATLAPGATLRDHGPMAHRQHPQSPVGTDEQRLCARGQACAGATRDTETDEWHPMPVGYGFCPADATLIEGQVPLLPGSYARLQEQMADPFRSRPPGGGGRRPPASRVLVDASGDALLREAALVLSGWAARVRAVPGISHSPRRHRPDTLEGVTESCDVLAKWTTQLLALPPGPTLRTWEYLPGRETRNAPAVPCRHCGAFVSPSPSGRHYWPAVCTHAVVVPALWREGPDGTRTPVAWACAACSTLFRGSPPARRPPCAHQPAAARPAPAQPHRDRGRTQADVEEEIAGLEVVRAGDGWVTVLTDLSGIDAGLDVLELAARFRRILLEAPAPPETFDGVPCRECDTMGSLEATPLPVGGGDEEHDPYSRCSVPACRAAFTRKEHDEWVKMYAAWTRGAGILVCARCERGDCRSGGCLWDQCACAARGHAAA